MAGSSHHGLMGQLRVTGLCAEEVDEALVLAQLLDPGLGVEAWRADALAVCTGGGPESIVLARRGAGPVCGFGRYRLDDPDAEHPTLRLLKLVAFDLTRPGPIATALVDEILQRARARGCEAVRIDAALTGPAQTVDLAIAGGVCRLHSVF
ncbi:MAG: hypothetical protein K2X25_11620 [Caulobacteraceae bacterium]|nr:hypothetical protein [Caulobacteraceae bacterium]